MSRKHRDCKPAAGSGPGIVQVLLLVLALLTASVMLLVLDWQEARWLLPLLLGGDALLIYFVWAAPGRLGYRAGKDKLIIETFAGKREIEKSEVRAVRKVEYRLGLKVIGSEMPGYNVGTFKSNFGTVRAFVSAKRGRGVLLELKNGEKTLINPRNPERCLEPLGLELEEKS